MRAGNVPGRAMADTDWDESRRRKDEPPPLEFLRPGETQAPPSSPAKPAAWVTRPEDFERPTPAWPTAPATSKARATIGGILLILTALILSAETFLVYITPPTPEEIQAVQNFTASDFLVNAAIIHVLLWAEAVAFLGGVMSLQRRNWKLAVGCAFVAVGGGVFTIFGLFLGIASLLLILTARREFKS